MVLEAIRFDESTSTSSPKLLVLDQLQLPHTTSWLTIKTSEDAFEAIKRMQVRGAPAIALVAALSLVVEDPLSSQSPSTNAAPSGIDTSKLYIAKLDHLVTSRPTAVNLSDAAAKLGRLVSKAADTEDSTGQSVRDAYVAAAMKMLHDDVQDNRAIGTAGAEWLRNRNTQAGRGAQSCAVLTHCNTG